MKVSIPTATYFPIDFTDQARYQAQTALNIAERFQTELEPDENAETLPKLDIVGPTRLADAPMCDYHDYCGLEHSELYVCISSSSLYQLTLEIVWLETP
jgi:hypothetical protein